MTEPQVLEPPVDERVAGDDVEPPPAAPIRRLRLKIVAIVVGALLVLGAAFGGGVLVGRIGNPGGGPTQGQFGDGGPGGFGNVPGGGTQQGGTTQDGSGQGAGGTGTGNGGTGA